MEEGYARQIIEALIFASDEPIPASQIKSFVEDVNTAQVRKAVEELNLQYKKDNRAFHIVEAGGGYQMVTRDDYSQWVKKLFVKKRKSRLSQAALEALSVVAFRQPVTRTEVEDIRGVNSDAVLRTLLERKLITISGRSDGPGRPLLYRTTREFLRYFGVNSVSDLPKPREIEELLKEEGDQQEDTPE